MIPIGEEVRADKAVFDAVVNQLLRDKLLILECNTSASTENHRGQSYTIDINDNKYVNVILKSKYKLRNGQTRLKFIIDERKELPPTN